jgi:hypothetical protein
MRSSSARQANSDRVIGGESIVQEQRVHRRGHELLAFEPVAFCGLQAGTHRPAAFWYWAVEGRPAAGNKGSATRTTATTASWSNPLSPTWPVSRMPSFPGSQQVEEFDVRGLVIPRGSISL